MALVRKESSTGIQHIEIIISDIEEHIKNKQDFVAFILIALGIEFLGSFFDDKDFNDNGQSEIRFKNGISKLFKNNWYKNNSDWLFKKFRGPLIHQYRTSKECLLTSQCKNSAPISEHLKEYENRRILVLECLFEDFKLASHKLKNLAQKNNNLKKEKLDQDYLTIFDVEGIEVVYSSTIQNDTTQKLFSVSGSTETPNLNLDQKIKSDKPIKKK